MEIEGLGNNRNNSGEMVLTRVGGKEQSVLDDTKLFLNFRGLSIVFARSTTKETCQHVVILLSRIFVLYTTQFRYFCFVMFLFLIFLDRN